MLLKAYTLPHTLPLAKNRFRSRIVFSAFYIVCDILRARYAQSRKWVKQGKDIEAEEINQVNEVNKRIRWVS